MSRSTMNPTDYSLWIVGAFEPEVDLLRAATIPIKTDSFETETLAIQVFTGGVGCIESALALQRLLSENPLPDEIIFVGSCGDYNSDSQIGRVVCANVFTLWDGMAMLGEARHPEPMRRLVEADRGRIARAYAAQCQGLAMHGAVNTTNSVTLRDMRRHLSDKENQADAVESTEGPDNIQYENLEAFGLALAAEGIPFTALLAITNRVHADGSSEWKKNFRDASTRLQRELIAVLNTVSGDAYISE